jgi:hypothetical protein
MYRASAVWLLAESLGCEIELSTIDRCKMARCDRVTAESDPPAPNAMESIELIID